MTFNSILNAQATAAAVAENDSRMQAHVQRDDVDINGVNAGNNAGVTALGIADVAGPTDVVNGSKELKDMGPAVPDQRDGTAPMYAGGLGMLALGEGFKACVELLCIW